MKERYFRFVTRRPGIVLAAVLAITVVLAVPIVDWSTGTLLARIETDVDGILPRAGLDRERYEDFRRRFGNDEMVFVALVVDDVFTRQNLDRLRRITTRLEALDGVKRVSSLANTPDVRFVDGQISARPFVEEAPSDPAVLETLRRAALSNPVHVGKLISKDGTVAVLVVQIRDMSELEFLDRGLDREIERAAREEAGDGRIVVAGPPIVKAETARLLVRDLATAGPGIFLAMALVACLTFRTPYGVLIPTVSIGLAQLWTIGIVVATGHSLNLVTSIVPPLINTVGFAYAIHLVAEYDQIVGPDPDRAGPAAVREALPGVSAGVFLCALTTVAGCLSLYTNPLPVIGQFGLFCALGVSCAFVVAMTFAPAMLVLSRGRPRSRASGSSLRLEAMAERIAHFDVRHSSAIFAVCIVLTVLAIVAVSRIEVNTSLVNSFRADSPLRRDIETFDRRVSGSLSFHVVVDGGAPDAFKEPANLQRLVEIQRWLESQPEIGGTVSIADHVRVVNSAFRGGDPDALVVPDSRRLVAQFLFFLWNDQLSSFVDRSYASAAILVQAPYGDSQEVSKLLDRIDQHLATLPAPLQGFVTGNTPMIVRTIDEIAIGQALSLATASILIVSILVAHFRSLRLGLLALAPNLLPVLIFFAALPATGISLNVTTSLIATIVLGVSVDDTCLFLVRYERLARQLGDAEQAVADALRHLVRPVASTNAALMLGFLVLATSHLKHQVEFGVLAAGTLAFALLMDLTLTPALAHRLGIPRGADEAGAMDDGSREATDPPS